MKVDGNMYYNPSTNTLTVSNFDGNATTATNATNAGTLDGYDSSVSTVASTVVVRDSSGNINGKYFLGEWIKATHGGDSVSSASYFPGVSSEGWYYHLTQGNMQTALNVPTRTGGNASGTWGINITGNSATASIASQVTVNNSDSNGSYYMLWHSGNTVYKTNGIYCNPSSDTVYATNFNSLSDVSLKENIRIVEDPLTILKDIEGVKFDWKETGKSTLGVIAQNVETVLPELVDEDDEGIKSVNYSGLISVLIEAVKEQQKQIDELKKLCQK